MIGQLDLIKNMENLVSTKKFPRFCIITGQRGSGKKLLAHKVAGDMGIDKYVLPDIKVDSIRQMIKDCYHLVDGAVYIIEDADDMSVQAKNAILKITEEPPDKAYFIMTLEDLGNTLPTVRSRAQVFTMQGYTQEEIEKYAVDFLKVDDGELDIIKDLCETPGEASRLHSQGTEDLYDYVTKVVGNVATVSGSNAFKIADKLSLKTGDEGYDLILFFKAFMTICMQCFQDDPMKYAAGVSVTSRYLQELSIRGINKHSLFDAWLLDIRKEWM